ncbi:PREDICTED: zinc finger protein 583-like isoform X1 [Papilio xuthus]|uniref:Zinc finger protein 583-like isoform X1 n=1 Tax=Papilio xuthus TaxID=66420 RepID=A0AAJ6Z3L0_PAPXU|nr:PREDICTED: zinc finger protein 583-like isoform X1 [Papilio xuthus]
MGASTHIFLEDIDIIPDVHKLCRLCLRKTEDSLPIYRDPKPETCPDVASRISTCVGIEVSMDDCLPNKLCKQCYREIERCYIFRKKCEDTNKKLQLHAKAVRENKKILENQGIVKTPVKQENNDSLLLVSKETKSVKTYANRLANKKNNGNLHSNTKKEIQESKPKVESEKVEPSFEAFLKTVLLQLGVVETKDEKIILNNPNVKALEIETHSGKVLVELTEEDDQDNNENHLSDNAISTSNSVNSIQTSEKNASIKLEQDTNGKISVVSGGVSEGVSGVGQWVRCETCSKQFASRSALRRHERVHSGERPHACRVCRRTFAQRSVMLRHELVHREQRPHQCLICPKSFTQRAALDAHALAHAEPQRRALSLRPCPHCNKVFLYASGLSRHMRVHSGRVFECGECARPFGDKSSLLRHLRSVPHPPRATPQHSVATPLYSVVTTLHSVDTPPAMTQQ